MAAILENGCCRFLIASKVVSLNALTPKTYVCRQNQVSMCNSSKDMRKTKFHTFFWAPSLKMAVRDVGELRKCHFWIP